MEVPLLSGSLPCRLATISRLLYKFTAGFSWYFLQLIVPAQSWLTSQSQITLRPTVSRPACLGFRPHLGPRWDLCYCETIMGLIMWGALSDEWVGLPFATAVNLSSSVILGSEPRGTLDHILLSQIRDNTNLKDHVPVFIFPREAQLTM
jgi:hypothetical protein